MDKKLPNDPIRKLKAIMSHLRGPDGCPWDALQTPESLKPYLLEECYEVLSALDSNDSDEIRKELGDLLLQIVFLTDIFEERGEFDFNSVADSICEKLIRRHPHVFSDVEETDLDKLNKQWEEIKRTETKSMPDTMLPLHQSTAPALLQAQRVSNKVAKVGFDWRNYHEVMGQLDEELQELNEAISVSDKNAIQDEIGDILFTIVNLGRHLEIDCELALHKMISRFRSRFEIMERLIRDDSIQIDSLEIESLNTYWQKAKVFDAKKS